MPADRDALVWTREAPTVPGHFWIRFIYTHGPGDPFMCEAVPFGFGDGIHHLAFIGLEDEFDVPSGPLNEWDYPSVGSAIAVEWSGPIPLPKEAT